MFVTYVNSASTRVSDLVCGSLCRTFGQKPFTFFSLGLEALPALGGYTMDPNAAPAEGYGTPGAEQHDFFAPHVFPNPISFYSTVLGHRPVGSTQGHLDLRLRDFR